MNQPTFEEIIAFANRCFAKDFKQIQPKIYNHPEFLMDHRWIYSDNKLIGLLGHFPIQLVTPTHTLNGMDIGTVCVDPAYRNQGIMTQLIHDCEPTFQTQDFICLSNRSRYEHFGFGLGGFDQVYESSSIKQTPMYQFEPMTNNETWLTKCWKLHQSQPYHIKRNPETFLEILKTAKAEPYFIIKNDTCIGYLIFAPKYNYISELLVSQTESTQVIVQDFLTKTKQDKIRISYQYGEKNPYQKQIPILTQPLKRFRIINYPKVIQTLLSWKQTLSPLTSGTIILEIIDHATYQITVHDTEITVIESEQTPDLRFNELEAEQFLLWDHQTASIPTNLKGLCDNWFPLPIVIQRNDFH